MLQLEEVRRENKTLSNEIKDIMDQITEGGRSIHEIDKIRKRLEAEKMELQSALGKAEALRMKKKLEADSADLGLALEHAIAGNAETQSTIKKHQLQVRDAQVKVDAESQSKSAAADAKVSADRKAAAMQNCLEESR